MNNDVSIVIPTWNGLSLLKRFLPSVISAANCYASQSNNKVEIVIVDDGSTDETVEWLQAFSQESGVRSQESEGESREVASKSSESIDLVQLNPQSAIHNPQSELPTAYCLLPTVLRYVRNETNMGFSMTCNKGIAAAQFPHIFLLNNDVEIAVDSIAPLISGFADKNVFAVHCRVFELESGRECGTGKVGGFARGFIRVHQSYATIDDKKNVEQQPLYSMFAGGGSAMFDREKFLSMGGFECLLSPFYWEDVELSYRAWKRGYTVLYEPRSIVHHRVSSTISKLNQHRVRMIEQRNRIIYHWIHLQDFRMLVSHILWLTLLGLTAPLRFKPMFFLSCVEALKRIPAIRKRRAEEKQKMKRTDRELFAIFKAFKLRTDVKVYDGIKASDE
jgi:GT2 family glycosyltransferase